LELTDLGTTGLRTTPVGLGLAALGRPGYINLGHDADLGPDKSVDALRDRTHDMLDAAWHHGIRYFDAARSYGRAEEFLGSWLRHVERPGVTVGSKWGYRYTADWRVDAEVHEVKEHTLAHFEAQRTETGATLGDHLDLYQVHSATPTSGLFDDPALLDRLARLRDTGVVVGLSLSGVPQAETLRRALDVERGGRPLFGAVQATWNLLERSVAPALEEAHERGVGVIIKEGLANGRLTDRGAPSVAAADRAERLGVGLDALALAAVIAQPFVDVVLSGAATRSQLASNLAALDVPIEEARAAVADTPPEVPGAYWSTRSTLPWS